MLFRQLKEALLQYRNVLSEATEEKLTHLEHAEDHPINAGVEGYHHAVRTLQGTHDLLRGKKSSVSITGKYDGSPSVVFGHHPETGKFFVASKSAFNKNPKLNYTAEDVEKNHGHAPGLVSKLKTALHHLPKITPRTGVYQGDFMYAKHDKDVSSSEGKYHFRPNTISYSAHHDSSEGKKIAKAKMGIVVHTAYHGPSLDHMKAEYNANLTHFKKHDDVHLINPAVHIGKSAYKPEAQREFKAHMAMATKAHKRIGDYGHLDGHVDTMKTYINGTVRRGEAPTTKGYISHLRAHHAAQAEKVKTAASIEKKKMAGEAAINHVKAHKGAFDSTFTMHKHLQAAKNVLVNSLASSPHSYGHSIAGKEAKPEGFVAAINNRPTKLVDRAEFSRANLNKEK